MGGETFTVVSPADGSVYVSLPYHTDEQAAVAVGKAHDAYLAWKVRKFSAWNGLSHSPFVIDNHLSLIDDIER